MIFVTVGTNPDMGFDRFVKAMDELAATLEERVVIQHGCSSYKPQHAEHFDFISGKEFEQLNKEARLVVSHAAAGAAIVALRHHKPLVVVPRLKQFNEHIDDHQLQLAAALKAEKKAIVVHEPSAATLRTAIAQATQLQGKPKGANQLVQALRGQLELWNPASRKRNRFSQAKSLLERVKR